MELRYLVKQYPQPSAQAVKEYMALHACGPAAAKKALKTPNQKILQFKINDQDWVDVPTVVQYTPDPLNSGL